MLFAGATVVIALLGLFSVGLHLTRAGIAVSAFPFQPAGGIDALDWAVHQPVAGRYQVSRTEAPAPGFGLRRLSHKNSSTNGTARPPMP